MFIISVNAIESLSTLSNSRLQIKLQSAPDLTVTVSREKVKDFKNWME